MLVTDQLSKLIHYYKKDLQNRAEMYLIKLQLMTNSTQWQVLGKYLFSYLHLFVNNRFNAIHIP
jgi:hypothetical protein